MSNQPPNYDRQFNFENYQSLNPSAPLPANQLESELNAASTSVNQTISRLNELQNADGSLKVPAALAVETTAVATSVATSVANSATQAYLSANYDPNVAINANASAVAANTSANAAQGSANLAAAHANYAEQYGLFAQTAASDSATARSQARDAADDANTSKTETASLAAAVSSDYNNVSAVYSAALSLKNWIDSESFQFVHKREDLADVAGIMLFNDGEVSNTLVGKVFTGASVNPNSVIEYRPPTSGTSVGNMDIFSGPWWVEGHDSPEDPHKIVMRDMMSCLVDTWLTFGPRVGPWSGGIGNLKVRQNGINGAPQSSFHQGEEYIKGVNYSKDGFGIGIINGSDPLTPKGYVDEADTALSGRIDLKANKSGDTFTGKVNMTPSATTASLNLGSQQTSPSLTIAGDIWIGANINYKSWDGVTKAVANTNTANQFTQGQAISVNSTSNAFRINQTGTGPALVVEDSTSPDATPFVIDANGRVGIGVAPSSTAALKVDAGGVMFNDGTTLTTADHNHTISQVTGLQDAINATKLREYDNFKIYTTNDLVLATNKIFKFNNYVGAAGYGPITHPTYWTEQSAAPDLTPYATISYATSQFVGKGQPGSVPSTGISGQVLTKLGASPSACTWEWPSQPDLSPYARIDGATFTGKVITVAPTSSTAGINIGSINSTANLTNSVAGDVWIGTWQMAYKTANGTIVYGAATNASNVFGSPQVIDTTNNTMPALRVTQKGTGEAIRVEDSTTPDTTSFIVGNDGKVGIGVNAINSLYVLDVNGSTSRINSYLEVTGSVSFGNGINHTGGIITLLNNTGYSNGISIADAVGPANQSKSFTFASQNGVNSNVDFIVGSGNSINTSNISLYGTLSLYAPVFYMNGAQRITSQPNTGHPDNPALHVINTTTEYSLIIEDSYPDSTKLIVDAAGNLGVGVNTGFTPTQKVEVVGNVKADGFVSGSGPVFKVNSVDTHGNGANTHDILMSVNGSTYRIPAIFVSTP